jgi:hypothetical protein
LRRITAQPGFLRSTFHRPSVDQVLPVFLFADADPPLAGGAQGDQVGRLGRGWPSRDLLGVADQVDSVDRNGWRGGEQEGRGQPPGQGVTVHGASIAHPTSGA